jgi:hypothetical protein
MTAPSRRLEPSDEALLERLASRLTRIDQEIPRSRAAERTIPLAGPHLHVVRGRTRRASRRRLIDPPRSPGRRLLSPAGVGIAAVAGLVVAVGALAGAGQVPGLTSVGASPTPSASAVVTASGAMSSAAPGVLPPLATPSGGDVPGPPSSQPPLQLGGSADAADVAGLRQAMATLGWPCVVAIQVTLDPIAPGLVTKLQTVGRHEDGFVPGEPVPTWIGSDPGGAALAFKGRRLGSDSDRSTWILRQGASGGALVQLVGQPLPSGASLWRSGDVAWPVDCSEANVDPKVLLGRHPGIDWPVGQVADFGVVRLRDGRQPRRAR